MQICTVYGTENNGFLKVSICCLARHLVRNQEIIENIRAFQFIVNNPEDFKIQDVGDTGVVNYVFRVSSRDTKQSVIIKYGEETMKVSCRV